MNTILTVMVTGVIGLLTVVCIILIAYLSFVKSKGKKKNVGGGGITPKKEDGRPLPPKEEKNKENN